MDLEECGKEIGGQFEGMGLLQRQIVEPRTLNQGGTVDSGEIYRFGNLVKMPSLPTLVIGPDGRPVSDSEVCAIVKEAALNNAMIIANKCRRIELTDRQLKWSRRVFDGSKTLLNVFGLEPAETISLDNIHLIGHRDFQDNVPGAQKDGELDGSRAGIIQGAMTEYRQIYIDASQDLWEFLHSLTHEEGHANAKLKLKAHFDEKGKVRAISHQRIGLRKNERGSDGHFHTPHALLDEGIVELFAILKRVNLYMEYEDELRQDLGENGVTQLLAKYSDLNIGLRLILGVIEHMAKSLNTSAVHILIKAIQGLNADSDEFYKLMELTLDPEFLKAYEFSQPKVFLLALKNGYVADLPNNRPYTNETLDQAVRFILVRKVQMQIEGLVGAKS